MRLSDLDLRELLDFSPRGGIIRFAGQRAVILDTVVLGLLRKEIMETVGQTVARGILTRLGFAHGWRTAQALRTAIPWESEREWRIAGGRLHMLQGLVVFDPRDADSADQDDPFARAIWHESYEAEQHLLNFGKSPQPVCWTLSGFVSGYLSFANDREIYCIETRCQGCGDECCSFVARSREQWGSGINEHLPFYKSDCLSASLDQITRSLKRAESQLEQRRQELQGTPAPAADDPSGLVARSEGMRRVVELARRVAKVDSTVLVTGESGVGKERIARLIHDQSQRAAGPFVAVNCGAVSETLLESELFGHARGSFSGATQDRAGLFEAATGGTLFLDEIGEVSPAMQVKLLRVLQEKEVRRVGENKSRPVDARIIAATNRELPEEVAASRFRSDLFYRLRVIEIRIPPLRERRDDILPLARSLTARTARRLGLAVTGFTPAAADRLARHPWPGNVRELENAVERAVVLAEHDRFDVGDLPEEVRIQPPERVVHGPDTPLEEVEKAHILAVLRAHGGNRARAAEALQIGLATLYRKLKAYESAAS
jgi:DNA-binding NtrC family response regulator